MGKKKNRKPSKANVQQALGGELQGIFDQGVALHRQGRLAEAAQCYQLVLSHQPDHADSLHLSGLIADASGDHDNAIDLISRAIKLNRTIAAYHYNLGIACQHANQLDAAIAAYQKAIRLDPDNHQVYENLGVAQQDNNQHDAAAAAYCRALELSPRSVVGLKNLGTLRFQSGDTQQALSLFERALEVDPANPDLHTKRAGCLMRTGRYFESGVENQWRHSSSSFLEHNPARSTGLRHADPDQWSKEHILVLAEEGVGDEIMYAGCIPDLLKRTRAITLECDPRLLGLFSRSFGTSASFIAKGTANPADYDSALPAGDLPALFRHNDHDFPRTRYLWSDPQKLDTWRKKIEKLPGALKIGISWRGGIDPRAVAARSLIPADWRPLLSATPHNFINLQYLASEQELKQFNKLAGDRFVNFDELDAFKDLESLATVIDALDLIITADNATAHLAGALGKSVWLLLPPGPDSRWPDGSDSAPWYAAVRQFRYPDTRIGNWQKLLSNLSQALDDFTPSPTKASELEIPASRQTSISKSESLKPSITLLNDTSNWYHWGCSCTSLAIHQELRERGYLVKGIPISKTCDMAALPQSIDDFDDDRRYKAFITAQPWLQQVFSHNGTVVINGEGTLHGNSNAAIGMLYLAYIAKQRFDNSVSIINHSCYPDLQDTEGSGPLVTLYKKVYNALDDVVVREPRSRNLLRSQGINMRPGFDCLPLFLDRWGACGQQDSNPPTVVIAGSELWQSAADDKLIHVLSRLSQAGYRITLVLGAGAHMASTDVSFASWLNTKFKAKYTIQFARSEREWLGCIAAAKLVLSGRFHHSIAAAFSGTPFVVTDSNTPKIDGLIDALELPRNRINWQSTSAEALWTRCNEALQHPSDFLLDATNRSELVNAARENFRLF